MRFTSQLFIQLPLGQLDPAPGPPPAETMRPNAPHDPAVEFVEERSNVGAFVVLGPTSQGRIQFLYQLRCLALGTASRQPPHSIPESSNGFACGIALAGRSRPRRRNQELLKSVLRRLGVI